MVVRLPWLSFLLLLATGAQLGAEESLARRDVEILSGKRHLGLIVSSLGAGALAHQFDDHLRGPLTDHSLAIDIMRVVEVYGSGTYGFTAAFGVWSWSRVTGMDEARQVSLDIFRALALSHGLVTPLKLAFRRQRPDGSNRRSFPSGHTGNAFAVTTVLARRCSFRLGLPLYALTVLVPISRIHHRRHFLSDVVAGAALGSIAGFAAHRQANTERCVVWFPIWDRGSWQVQIRRVY